MGRTAATIVLTFGVVLLVAGTAFAVNRMCPDNCRGTADDDRLVGSSRSNTIYAEDGNDRVKGGHGKDRVDGGEGNDLVRGGTHSVANDHARDLLICGPGRDKVFFVRGQDVLRGCEIKRPSN
jgi:Ca2+-binding RTX toxin-like protein